MKKKELIYFIQKSWGMALTAGQWWLSELMEIIPTEIRQKFFSPSDVTVISVEGGSVIVRYFGVNGGNEMRSGSVGELNQISDPAGNPHKAAIIALSVENVFVSDFRVPISAHAKLRQAVSFEVERRSPFRSGDALFDFSVVSRDDKTLTIEWVTIPAELIKAAKDIAQKLGYFPSAVGLLANNNKDLKYVFAKYKSPAPFRLKRPLMAMLCSLALFICLAIYGVYSRVERVTAAIHEVSALKASALQAENARLNAEKTEGALSIIVSRAKEPRILDILHEVTNVLPEDTWVFELDLKGDQLRIVGYSAAASSLIEHFTAIPTFDRPHFHAPITPQIGKNTERFDIAMTIHGRLVKGKDE